MVEQMYIIRCYIRTQFWKPTDINNIEQTIQEINAIKPIVELVHKIMQSWTLVKTRGLFLSMEFVANPGRNVKFLCKG